MGVPKEYMFNCADLDHTEDRLCVANCLLWLKLLQDSSTGNGTASKSGSPPRVAQPPNSARSHRSSSMVLPQQQDFQQPQYSHRGGSQHGGATGVTKLMQECTVLLKAKMSYSSNPAQMTPRSSDAFSFDAVGPVLESVLGGLTQVRQTMPEHTCVSGGGRGWSTHDEEKLCFQRCSSSAGARKHLQPADGRRLLPVSRGKQSDVGPATTHRSEEARWLLLGIFPHIPGLLHWQPLTPPCMHACAHAGVRAPPARQGH
eukprot:1141888-Pelagomonas_calceolata.AAC.3